MKKNMNSKTKIILIVSIIVVLGICLINFINDQKKFGSVDVNRFESGVTNSYASIGTTSATVIAANSARQYARIQNQGSAPVFVSLGSTATIGSGIILEGSTSPTLFGGIFEITPANLYTGIVSAISGVATQVITFVEK